MHYLLAAGAAPPFLVEVATLVIAGAVVAYVCNRFGVVPIVGFLLAGVLIGPNSLGLVTNRELIDAAAEIGVMLLLFTIGIEFSLDKLAKLQRMILVGGGLQVLLTTGAVTGLLLLFGIAWPVGVFTGFLVALSSTAIVLKLLSSRGETGAPAGQISLSFLIFQDVAIIVMVLLVPMLGGTGGSALEITVALGTAVALIAVVLVVARKLMPLVLEAVARTCSPEIFLLTIAAICFGTAWLTSLAGVSVSLGAFLAGLVVSESRFSEHALGEILPLQILFSATFFVSVGMLLDVRFLVMNLPLVLGVIAAVLLIKIVTTGVSAAALGMPVPVVAAASLMLAQVGEFSFVLERAGREVGLTPAGLGLAGAQTFIAATVVLMVLTPVLAQLGTRLGRWIERRQETQNAAALDAADVLSEEYAHLENHVIVAGYGQTARRLVPILAASGVPYVITTLSPTGANEAEREGLPVLRADAARQRTLFHVGAERAKVLVIADDEPGMAERIAAVARVTNPTMRVVVATRYLADVSAVRHAGADRVVAEELERVLGIFDDVLHAYQVPPRRIEAFEAELRMGDYALLRARQRDHEALKIATPAFDTRTVTLREGVPAIGQSLRELDLRRAYALTVRSVRRADEVTHDPAAGFVLEAGDELVMAGTADDFARAAPLFRPPVSADGGDGLESNGAAAAPQDRPQLHQSEIDMDETIELPIDKDDTPCTHTGQIRAVHPSAPGCEECLRMGDEWVHLRICMTCGHVGCCDSSKNKHASKHAGATEHPIVRSVEPGERWGWCYADEVMLEPAAREAAGRPTTDD